MKKSRRPSQSSGTQTSVTEEKKPSGNRGRPKKTVPVTTDNLYHDDAAKDNMADLDCSVNAAVDTQKPPEGKTRAAGQCPGRMEGCFIHPKLGNCFVTTALLKVITK